MTSTLVPRPYPVEVTGRLDRPLSRWLWLVKWLLVLPHVVVLVALWAGFVVMTVVAFFAILFTGRYPRVVFDYNVGVLRWTWRVCYYAYGALGTDAYPPFTLADRPDYPATLHIDHPEHLSHGLVLVKWLLALPHLLVVCVFLGGAYAVGSNDSWTSISLIGLLVLVAAVALLFTGIYPRPIFDFVLGMNRWVLRVAAYVGLMTDRYPPFRLDQGGADAAIAPSPDDVGVAAQPPAAVGRWTGGRVTAVSVGALACLLGLGAAAAGGALLVADQVSRNAAGFVSTGSQTFRTPTTALLTDADLTFDGPGWLSGPKQLGTVALTVRAAAGRPVFVGIGPRDEVTRWLSGTAYAEVTDFGNHGSYRRAGGTGPAPDPRDQTFWVAQRAGLGEQRLTWPVTTGHWAVVVMNADGSRGVAVDAKAAATLPHLTGIAAGLVTAGGVTVLLGALAIGLGVPRRPGPSA